MQNPSTEHVRTALREAAASTTPLKLKEKVYVSASEALEDYIADFERRPNFYVRRPSDLLAPKAKFYFMDALERSTNPNKSSSERVDELLSWVNETYWKDLRSRVQPFGTKIHVPPEYLPGSAKEQDMFRLGMQDVELSTLPSPGTSQNGDTELDSEADTEVLLKSYRKQSRTAQQSRSRRSPAKDQRHYDGHRSFEEYPSWVEGIINAPEYPSWVEDLDRTTLSERTRRSPRKHGDERGASSSGRRVSPNRSKSSPSKSGAKLHFSDLHVSSKKKSPYKSPPKMPDYFPDDITDVASTDTEFLCSQPVFGSRPVNMGGTLHSPLYADRRVDQIFKESTRKVRKSPSKMHRSLSPKRDTTYESNQMYSSLPPRKTKHYKSPQKQLFNGSLENSALRASDLRMSPQDRRKRTPSSSPQRHSSPLNARAQAYSQNELNRVRGASSQRVSSQVASSSRVTSRSHSPSHEKPRVYQSTMRQDSSDLDSMNTDEIMRRSPTGIHMASRGHPSYAEETHDSQRKTAHHTARKVVSYQDQIPQYSKSPAGYARSRQSSGYYSKEGTLLGSDEEVSKERTRGVARERRMREGASYARASSPIDEHVARKPPSGHRRSKTLPADLRHIEENLRLSELALSKSSHETQRQRQVIRHHGKSRMSRKHQMDEESLTDQTEQTSDTEFLLVHPPMPVFDASPSLTTITDSEANTVIDTNDEENVTFSAADNFSYQAPSTGLSPTSAFASQNARHAVTNGEDVQKPFHLWEQPEASKIEDSRSRLLQSAKPGLIHNFLEDCLKPDEELPSTSEQAQVRYHSTPASDSRLTGQAAPGPVEALKQMLFTMQGMASDGSMSSESLVDFKQISSTHDKGDDLSDADTDTATDLAAAENSLARAYHHLNRLKKLVGSEDENNNCDATS